MGLIRVEAGDVVFTHLSDHSRKNSALKGTLAAKILSVNPGLLNARVELTKSGTVFTVPLSAIVRKVTPRVKRPSLADLEALKNRFNS
uniref:Uncharacterized protein n=1 Tax=viral metagenome TaxID=1070528 RepID=A0A6M3KB65_9ZZZZ